MSTREHLNQKLVRILHFSNPPAEVYAEALDAYASHVQSLEAEISRLNTRVGEEVSFQRSIRTSEQEVRADLMRRQQEEKRTLIREIGFAAVIRDRVLNAKWQGRKTVKIADLLEGRPDEDES